MTGKKWNLGLDIGGTKILIANILDNGNIVHQNIIATNSAHGFESIFKEIISEVRRCIEIADSLPQTIGIGIAGQIIHDDSYLKRAPNLDWTNIPLQQLVYEQFKVPTVIINDVRAATWGEWMHGAGKGVSDLICIMVGTGIGGGIIVQNRLLTGFSGGAGEVGHVPIELNGPLCSCGNRGCFEAIAGGWAIAHQAKEAIRKDRSAGKKILQYVHDELEHITAKQVLLAAMEGDALAQKIMLRVEEAITAACIGFANIFNPSRILVGGSIGLAVPDLCERIQKGIQQLSMDANRDTVQVMPTQFKGDIVAIGAAGYASDKLSLKS
jgi:glucokinase